MKITSVAENIWSIRDVMDEDILSSILDEFKYTLVKLNKCERFDYLPPNAPRWSYLCKGGDNILGDNNVLINFGEKYKFLARKILKRDLILHRVNTNIQTTGQDASFHQDGTENFWTLLLFAQSKWDSDWGGEFICATEDTYVSVPYIPGNAALFRADYEHRGCAPNVLTSEQRVSIAFTYAEVE